MRKALWFVWIVLLSFATFGCGEESRETEQSKTIVAAPEPTQEDIDRELVKRAQEVVRQSGIDPCEQDVVYMVCGSRYVGEWMTMVKSDWSPSCLDGTLVCVGPRICNVWLEFEHPIEVAGDGINYDRVYRTRYTHMFMGNKVPYRIESGVNRLKVSPTEPQGHCRDEEAVLVQCPENPELDELLWADDVWTIVPCPGLTLVCPQERACNVKLFHAWRAMLDPRGPLPEYTRMWFGSVDGNYRIPIIPEDVIMVGVTAVSYDTALIREAIWKHVSH